MIACLKLPHACLMPSCIRDLGRHKNLLMLGEKEKRERREEREREEREKREREKELIRCNTKTQSRTKEGGWDLSQGV